MLLIFSKNHTYSIQFNGSNCFFSDSFSYGFKVDEIHYINYNGEGVVNQYSNLNMISNFIQQHLIDLNSLFKSNKSHWCSSFDNTLFFLFDIHFIYNSFHIYDIISSFHVYILNNIFINYNG